MGERERDSRLRSLRSSSSSSSSRAMSLMTLVSSNPNRYRGVFQLELLPRRGDYRERNMPDSPESKGANQSAPLPSSSMAGLPPMTRPVSAGSNVSSGMNGTHSPLSSLNGRTPSPPSLGGGVSGGQQLPPACGARQLSKLKRFLTTLQQFGSDISPEIGDRVRTLVLGLVNSHLSIEEFHAKLQEATNFPLRPFVIPFLKANLPLLQRELLHCARMAKQTPQQYLTQNEHVVFDPSHSPLEGGPDPLAPELNENGKRRSPDRPKENGVDSHLDSLHPAKRHHPISPMGGSRVSPNGSLSLNIGGPIRLEDISLSRELRERERAAAERERVAERERLERERDRDRHYSSFNYQRSEQFDPLDRTEDDWRHVDAMLNCMLGMVDKMKRALSVLQERSARDREELGAWMRRQAEGMDQDVKKRTSDMVAYTLRQNEDRVAEVRRRAEEAVNEVKRQAMLELQKAVQAAEAKANEMVLSEKTKAEQRLLEARKKVTEEVMTTINHQEESSESCWNCGRKANETCSGCNIARYCGSFCQHKDWENHHHVCGKTQVATIAEARDQRRSSSSSSSSSSTAPATVAAAAAAAAAAAGGGSGSLRGDHPSSREPPAVSPKSSSSSSAREPPSQQPATSTTPLPPQASPTTSGGSASRSSTPTESRPASEQPPAAR